MCLDTDEAAGNMGMLDQGEIRAKYITTAKIIVSFLVTALEWVHQYISYFGGDPNRCYN